MPPVLVSKVPQCTSCIRRITSLGTTLFSPAGQQLRGKKKLAKVSTITVQLLQNVPGYGRKGKILPICPGVMRNVWYPRRIAGYVTVAQLQTLGNKDIAAERDSTFGSKREREIARRARTPTTTKSTTSTPVRVSVNRQAIVKPERVEIGPIEPEIPSPEQATKIIDRLLPPSIDFYRTPAIATTPVESPPKRVSPSIPTGSALSRAAAAAAAQRAAKEEQEHPPAPEPTKIIGSVSTADIAANLKAILAEDVEGKRVVLLPEHISFVDPLEEHDRVKHVGSFEIEITLDLAPESIWRKINVKAQA